MTCLTASNTIHPISAPTGTDDDIGGNDKADALVAHAWNERIYGRPSVQPLLKAALSTGIHLL